MPHKMLKIIFEFVGGPNDGKVLHGTLGDASDAERYFLFTNHGAIGHRFKMVSDYAVETLAREQLKEEKRHYFRQHYYVISERLEEDEEVLVRATYVDKEPEPGARSLVRQHLETLPAGESNEQAIQRFLQQMARSMVESYSHSWPDESQREGTPWNGILGVHLSHVLLNERFAIFSPAAHSDGQLPPVDLLGLASSQDWFVACQLDSSLNNRDDFARVLAAMDRLRNFWLSSRLVIGACAEHLHRVARYCASGFGLVVGLHWSPQSTSELIELWQSQSRVDAPQEPWAETLAGLQLVWPPPLPLQRYREGTFYLLAVFFRIARHSEDATR